MLPTRIVLLSALIVAALSQATNIQRKNPLLVRKKRYLTFPKNSNFVINISLVKAFLQVQPRGWNVLGEMDFPFPLPSDTRLYKKFRRSHSIQRRELLTGLEAVFNKGGLNGSACVNRMICETRHFLETEGKSLVKDILGAIFKSTEPDWGERYEMACNTATSECEIPFLTYILGSLYNEL